jgi:hypothetical protein
MASLLKTHVASIDYLVILISFEAVFQQTGKIDDLLKKNIPSPGGRG